MKPDECALDTNTIMLGTPGDIRELLEGGALLRDAWDRFKVL